MDRLDDIEQRIRGVIETHEGFGFTPMMDTIAKVFLGLALEYPKLRDFARLAILLPKVVLGWDAAFFLTGEDNRAELVVGTHPEHRRLLSEQQSIQIDVSDNWYRHQDEYYFPLPNHHPEGQNNEGVGLPPVVGMLSFRPGHELDDTELFFLERYANLITLSMVHRLTTEKNQQHIDFIRKLVADIGHNVIVPNIFFKAYLRRLSGKIDRLVQIQGDLDHLTRNPDPNAWNRIQDLSEEMANANEGLMEEFDHIKKHYVNTSLFLETLLRQSHFEKGRYVLKKKTCNFRKDIIDPQMDQYTPKLKQKGIEVDLSAGGVPDQSIQAVVDVGLISQVFANLLSNAVKYTQTAPRGQAGRKFIAYGLEIVPGAFGPGEDGVKINLFTSGPPLEHRDVRKIFDEGYRGDNVGRERGTGHGLFFVKEVVELHGGRVGCDPSEQGNNFYFILPH